MNGDLAGNPARDAIFIETNVARNNLVFCFSSPNAFGEEKQKMTSGVRRGYK